MAITYRFIRAPASQRRFVAALIDLEWHEAGILLHCTNASKNHEPEANPALVLEPPS